MTLANPFQPAEQVTPRVKALVFGVAGVGKTYLGLTAPGKVAVVDTEGGTSFYANRVGKGLSPFDVLPTKTFAQVEGAIAYLKANPGEYETLVIDPVTVLYETLQDAALRYRTEKAGAKARAKQEAFDPDNVDLEQLDWGRIKRSYKRLMTDLVNLPLHVVVLAREADLTEERMENGRKQRVKIGAKPDAEKSTAYYFDTVIRLVPSAKGRDAIIEKDRTGTLELGSRHANATFTSLFSDAIAAGGTGERSLQSDEDAARIDADTTLTAGTAEGALSRPDGSFVGRAVPGNAPADFEVRDTPTGAVIAFRLTAGSRSMKVTATGALATAVAIARPDIEGREVICWGAATEESWTPPNARRPVQYTVLTLERLECGGIEIPAQLEPEAAGGPSGEQAANPPASPVVDLNDVPGLFNDPAAPEGPVERSLASDAATGGSMSDSPVAPVSA